MYVAQTQDAHRPVKVSSDCGIRHLSQSGIAVPLDCQLYTEAGWEVRSMRVVFLLTVCLLAGCAAGPSLEQLEQRALVTGDWSAVESRERSMQWRNQRVGTLCPDGYVSYCETRVTTKRCSCIDNRAFNSLMVTF